MHFGDKMESINKISNDKRKEIQLINEFSRTGNPERIILHLLELNTKTNEKIDKLKKEMEKL